MNVVQPPFGLQSTSGAGAVPVRNEKGELSMQLVKVQRYISGKKPEYAAGASSSDDSDVEDFIEQQRPERRHYPAPPPQARRARDARADSDNEADDPRLRRLRTMRVGGAAAAGARRHEHSPELIDEEEERAEASRAEPAPASASESEDELDEDEIQRRRRLLKLKLSSRETESEVLGRAEEEEALAGAERSASDSDDDGDDYTDSEEETGPRVKPVFVRASERMTVVEREKLAKQARREEGDAKRDKEERRKDALKLVEETIRSEIAASKQVQHREGNINDVCTDDENDELEYEAWKLRELKRIKRDKDERDALEKEALEIERLRNMTEDERRLEHRINPKVVTNKSIKGKYKFLQKYYHRGAFYLDKEVDVLKQDFSGPTLDDHFDKSVLPKVMQVKKFGRSGRTKYTHLVDQDTTQFDSPWCGETMPQGVKTHAAGRAGMKQVFQKPSNKRNH